MTSASPAAPLAALKSLSLPPVGGLQVQHLEAGQCYEAALLRLEATEVVFKIGVLLVGLAALS